jgi:hypothetical protein
MSDGQFAAPPEYAHMILQVAPLSFTSGMYALYVGHPIDIAVVPLAVGCTTILYWYHPTYSWRRTLDMAVVSSTCAYQSYRAFYAEYASAYFPVMSLAILSYLVGLHYDKKDKYAAMCFHAGVHIFANIALLVVYSGNI